MFALISNMNTVSTLRFAALAVFATLMLVSAFQSRARAQQGGSPQNDEARELVNAVVAAEKQYFAQHKKYAEAGELFGVPSYNLPLSLEEAQELKLNVALTTDGSFYFVSADGETLRYSSNSEGGVDATELSKLNERARLAVREVISAQAQYFANVGRYGSLSDLVAAQLLPLEFNTTPAHFGSGILVKARASQDGMSHQVYASGLDVVFEGSESGEVRVRESARASD